KAHRALSEFRIAGAPTNIGFLQNLLQTRQVMAGDLDTRFIETHMAELGQSTPARRYFETGGAAQPKRAGVQVDATDPLAVLALGKQERESKESGEEDESMHGPEGTRPLLAPLQGAILSISAGVGDTVRPGQQFMIMDSMKMEHVVSADFGGVVRAVVVAAGDVVFEGSPLAFIEEADVEGGAAAQEEKVDLD